MNGIVPAAALWLAAAAMAAGTPHSALHAYLISSVPADGDSLADPPAVIRLLFSEAVEPGLSEIELLGSGGTAVELAVTADPADARALTAEVPPLAPGAFRVVWRTVSADGHPVAGTFVFSVRPAAAEAAAEAEAAVLPPPPPQDLAPGGEVAGADASSARIVAALRGLASALLLALAGLLAFLGWRRAGSPIPGVALALAALAPLALAAHLAVWAGYAAGPGAWAEGTWVRSLDSTSGRIETARLVAAGLAGWALALARRVRLAAGFAALAVLCGSALGHSLAVVPTWSIPAKALHLAAAAAWLGGLAFLLLVRSSDDAFRGDAAAVSRVALAAVGAIVVSGVVQTALLLPSLELLWQSLYGRLVLAKAAGLAALIAFGALHRRRLLPRLAAGGAPAALRRWVRAEIAVMIAVLLLAGVLASVPVPAEAPAAAVAP